MSSIENIGSVLEAELNKRLAKIQPILQEVSSFSAGFIRQRAPVKTGFLRDHTGTQMQGEYAFELYSNADYSEIVNRRNPFFDDAVMTTKEKLETDLKKI